MSTTKHGPKLRAKVLTVSTRYFREREEVLLEAGFRWIFHKDQAQPVTNSGKLELPCGVRGIGLSVSSSGKKVIFPVMGTEEFNNLKSHRQISTTTELIGALREATTSNVEGVVECKHGSTPDSLREQLGAGAGGRVTVSPRPGETSRETFHRWQEKKMSLVAGSNHGADAMRYAYSGTDWAKNMAPKAYQLTAREHRDSIDFYEISKELTRNNPIAFVQGGKEISYGGFVVIHGQIIRQAGRKVTGEADVVLQHLMPGGFLGGMGNVSLRFKDAWVFECESGKEFALWKNWVRLVRSSRWDHTPAHTFTVTFPEA